MNVSTVVDKVSMMNSLDSMPLKTLPPTSAVVVSTDSDVFLLNINDAIESAYKAFSCLILPIAGDKVALFQDQNGELWITAILARSNNQGSSLSLPENCKLTCPDDLTLMSANKLILMSDEIIQMSHKNVQKSEQLTVDFSKAVVKGEKLASYISHINQVSDFISQTSKSMMQKFFSYVRKTDQADQVQAGQMGRKVDGLYSMNSKHTVMLSQKDTKIDGEHIHMG